MPRHNKKFPEKSPSSARLLSFQLSWGGLAGIAVVLFFLFLWMFLLGIWAGQTLLVTTTNNTVLSQERSEELVDPFDENIVVEVLLPRKRKQRVFTQEMPILQAE
jgi:hypothetical protein